MGGIVSSSASKKVHVTQAAGSNLGFGQDNPNAAKSTPGIAATSSASSIEHPFHQLFPVSIGPWRIPRAPAGSTHGSEVIPPAPVVNYLVYTPASDWSRVHTAAGATTSIIQERLTSCLTTAGISCNCLQFSNGNHLYEALAYLQIACPCTATCFLFPVDASLDDGVPATISVETMQQASAHYKVHKNMETYTKMQEILRKAGIYLNALPEEDDISMSSFSTENAKYLHSKVLKAMLDTKSLSFRVEHMLSSPAASLMWHLKSLIQMGKFGLLQEYCSVHVVELHADSTEPQDTELKLHQLPTFSNGSRSRSSASPAPGSKNLIITPDSDSDSSESQPLGNSQSAISESKWSSESPTDSSDEDGRPLTRVRHQKRQPRAIKTRAKAHNGDCAIPSSAMGNMDPLALDPLSLTKSSATGNKPSDVRNIQPEEDMTVLVAGGAKTKSSSKIAKGHAGRQLARRSKSTQDFGNEHSEGDSSDGQGETADGLRKKIRKGRVKKVDFTDSEDEINDSPEKRKGKKNIARLSRPQYARPAGHLPPLGGGKSAHSSSSPFEKSKLPSKAAIIEASSESGDRSRSSLAPSSVFESQQRRSTKEFSQFQAHKISMMQPSSQASLIARHISATICCVLDGSSGRTKNFVRQPEFDSLASAMASHAWQFAGSLLHRTLVGMHPSIMFSFDSFHFQRGSDDWSKEVQIPVGMEGAVQKVFKHLKGSSGIPLVIHGNKGCGRTVACQLALQLLTRARALHLQSTSSRSPPLPISMYRSVKMSAHDSIISIIHEVIFAAEYQRLYSMPGGSNSGKLKPLPGQFFKAPVLSSVSNVWLQSITETQINAQTIKAAVKSMLDACSAIASKSLPLVVVIDDADAALPLEEWLKLYLGNNSSFQLVLTCKDSKNLRELLSREKLKALEIGWITPNTETRGLIEWIVEKTPVFPSHQSNGGYHALYSIPSESKISEFKGFQTSVMRATEKVTVGVDLVRILSCLESLGYQSNTAASIASLAETMCGLLAQRFPSHVVYMLIATLCCLPFISMSHLIGMIQQVLVEDSRNVQSALPHSFEEEHVIVKDQSESLRPSGRSNAGALLTSKMSLSSKRPLDHGPILRRRGGGEDDINDMPASTRPKVAIESAPLPGSEIEQLTECGDSNLSLAVCIQYLLPFLDSTFHFGQTYISLPFSSGVRDGFTAFLTSLQNDSLPKCLKRNASQSLLLNCGNSLWLHSVRGNRFRPGSLFFDTSNPLHSVIFPSPAMVQGLISMRLHQATANDIHFTNFRSASSMHSSQFGAVSLEAVTDLLLSALLPSVSATICISEGPGMLMEFLRHVQKLVNAKLVDFWNIHSASNRKFRRVRSIALNFSMLLSAIESNLDRFAGQPLAMFGILAASSCSFVSEWATAGIKSFTNSVRWALPPILPTRFVVGDQQHLLCSFENWLSSAGFPHNGDESSGLTRSNFNNDSFVCLEPRKLAGSLSPNLAAVLTPPSDVIISLWHEESHVLCLCGNFPVVVFVGRSQNRTVTCLYSDLQVSSTCATFAYESRSRTGATPLLACGGADGSVRLISLPTFKPHGVSSFPRLAASIQASETAIKQISCIRNKGSFLCTCDQNNQIKIFSDPLWAQEIVSMEKYVVKFIVPTFTLDLVVVSSAGSVDALIRDSSGKFSHVANSDSAKHANGSKSSTVKMLQDLPTIKGASCLTSYPTHDMKTNMLGKVEAKNSEEYLAIGQFDGRISILSLALVKEVVAFRAHNRAITSVQCLSFQSFPMGSSAAIVTSSMDGYVRCFCIQKVTRSVVGRKGKMDRRVEFTNANLWSLSPLSIIVGKPCPPISIVATSFGIQPLNPAEQHCVADLAFTTLSIAYANGHVLQASSPLNTSRHGKWLPSPSGSYKWIDIKSRWLTVSVGNCMQIIDTRTSNLALSITFSQGVSVGKCAFEPFSSSEWTQSNQYLADFELGYGRASCRCSDNCVRVYFINPLLDVDTSDVAGCSRPRLHITNQFTITGPGSGCKQFASTDQGYMTVDGDKLIRHWQLDHETNKFKPVKVFGGHESAVCGLESYSNCVFACTTSGHVCCWNSSEAGFVDKVSLAQLLGISSAPSVAALNLSGVPFFVCLWNEDGGVRIGLIRCPAEHGALFTIEALSQSCQLSIPPGPLACVRCTPCGRGILVALKSGSILCWNPCDENGVATEIYLEHSQQPILCMSVLGYGYEHFPGHDTKQNGQGGILHILCSDGSMCTTPIVLPIVPYSPHGPSLPDVPASISGNYISHYSTCPEVTPSSLLSICTKESGRFGAAVDDLNRVWVFDCSTSGCSLYSAAACCVQLSTPSRAVGSCMLDEANCLVGCRDGSLSVVNVVHHRVEHKVQHGHGLTSMTESYDGKVLTTGSQGVIIEWNAIQAQQYVRFEDLEASFIGCSRLDANLLLCTTAAGVVKVFDERIFREPVMEFESAASRRRQSSAAIQGVCTQPGSSCLALYDRSAVTLLDVRMPAGSGKKKKKLKPEFGTLGSVRLSSPLSSLSMVNNLLCLGDATGAISLYSIPLIASADSALLWRTLIPHAGTCMAANPSGHGWVVGTDSGSIIPLSLMLSGRRMPLWVAKH